MTIKSVIICVAIATIIIVIGNATSYFISRISQPPNVNVVLEQLQRDGFTDSYISVDEKYSTRSIYVLDDAICIEEADDSHFWIFIKKDIDDEDMKYILSSVMYVFDSSFSSCDAEKILNLSKNDGPIKINNILYWPIFKNGKLSDISITM